jgi:hypothetical protein
MRFVGFIGPSYTSSSVNVDCQRCVNLYPEVDALGTGKEKEVASLVSTPGLTLLATVSMSPVRGLYTASNGTLFGVYGNTLYSFSSSWVATPIGTLITSTGYVGIADNGIELIIVDGPNGYYLSGLSSITLNVITDPGFLGSSQVTFQDGYFIFFEPNTQTFYTSNLYAVSFSGISVGAKSGSPDYIAAIVASQQNLYVFGTQSTEIFYDAGSTPFPFARVQGAVLRVGCSAPFSLGILQGSVFWVGGDDSGSGVVYMMSGYQNQRISTPAIETVIREIGSANIANIKAWTYQQGGHLFYCLNLPTVNSTWVYDVSTGLWHERCYLGVFNLERHRADCSALAYGTNVVGDYANGNLYSLDQNNFTDNNNSIVRLRTSPHLSQGLERIFHSSFQLDIESGVGLSGFGLAGIGVGVNPQAMLSWSDDGGHRWSNEHWTSMGKIGATKTRAIWRRLGNSRDRIYKVSISDPVRVTLIGAELNVQEGAS